MNHRINMILGTASGTAAWVAEQLHKMAPVVATMTIYIGFGVAVLSFLSWCISLRRNWKNRNKDIV